METPCLTRDDRARIRERDGLAQAVPVFDLEPDVSGDSLHAAGVGPLDADDDWGFGKPGVPVDLLLPARPQGPLKPKLFRMSMGPWKTPYRGIRYAVSSACPSSTALPRKRHDLQLLMHPCTPGNALLKKGRLRRLEVMSLYLALGILSFAGRSSPVFWVIESTCSSAWDSDG